MSRSLSLVLVAACLCAACTTPRRAETDVLVSSIVRGQSSDMVCRVGDVRLCTIDEDEEKQCTCVDHGTLFAPR